MHKIRKSYLRISKCALNVTAVTDIIAAINEI